jgi:hypothetical protein
MLDGSLPFPPPPWPLLVTFNVGAVLALVGLVVVGRLPIAGGAMAIVGGSMIGAVAIFLSPGWFIGWALFVPIIVIGAVRRRQVLEAQRQRSA